MTTVLKELHHLLTSNRKLTSTSLTTIRNFVTTHSVTKVPLWNMSPFMNYLIYFMRTQVFLYASLEIGLIGYSYYTKWHREKVRTKLIVLSGLAFVMIVGMVKGSSAMTRRAVK